MVRVDALEIVQLTCLFVCLLFCRQVARCGQQTLAAVTD